MKAAITTKAGGPEVIEIQEVAAPQLKSAWVLIKVKAFGLNRSELFTRRGESPTLHIATVSDNLYDTTLFKNLD